MNTKALIATLIMSSFTFIANTSFAQAYYGGWSSSNSGNYTTYTTPDVFSGGYTSRTYGDSGNSTTYHTPDIFSGGYTSRTYGDSGNSTTYHTPDVFSGGYTSRTYGW